MREREHGARPATAPTGRTGHESAVARPAAIPDDLDDPLIEKATGVVELPLHVQWSGRRSYDLSERRDRARVYELVLREGNEDDVRRFVRRDELEELWNDLLLPGHVRAAWEQKLAESEGVTGADRSPGTHRSPGGRATRG